MAPLPTLLSISDLARSSLELDSRAFKPFDLPSYLASLSITEREALTHPRFSDSLHKRTDDGSPILSPIEVFKSLTARNTQPTQSTNPAAGAINPTEINMKAVQAAFALIGASFVVASIWFFFWAKNGGFQWRKGDWDEYKSTVLRRKGPNGTTLSNATKSTRLGGGSVVGDGYSDAEGSVTEGTMTELSSEAPIIKEKQSNQKKKTRKETAKERKLREATEAQWEGGHDNDVRAYRHEKVARVGGLNKDSDAQYYGTDYTATERSECHSNSNSNRPSRQASPDKRQSRRDFSYGQDAGFNAAPQQPQQPSRPSRYHSPSKNPPRANKQSIPGSFHDPLDFSDVQSQHTKAYHHPIPGLGGQARAPGGYRRDRRDSLDD